MPVLKSIADEVWAFDAEWVPDPVAGRLLYNLPETMPDWDVVQEMWRRHEGSGQIRAKIYAKLEPFPVQ